MKESWQRTAGAAVLATLLIASWLCVLHYANRAQTVKIARDSVSADSKARLTEEQATRLAMKAVQRSHFYKTGDVWNAVRVVEGDREVSFVKNRIDPSSGLVHCRDERSGRRLVVRVSDDGNSEEIECLVTVPE